MEDASLSAFADDTASRDGADVDEPSTDAGVVEPATTTYSFEPAETACESCGASTRVRWHDEGALICPDCKDW